MLALCVSANLTATAGAQDAELHKPVLEGDGPWVVRVYVDERQRIDDLGRWADIWAVEPEGGYVLVMIDAADARRLAIEGLDFSVDKQQTRSFERVGIGLRAQKAGIPGFPCYRTVEETYATADAIVAAHPDLATLIDIGDSWEKTQNAAAGYDLRVLVLTQSAVPGPKPRLFGNFAIHAREYTTAELGTRFAEFLVDNYGVDPDVTWVLDHHEIHLNLIANPDGRKKAETGLSWRKNTNNDYCSNTDNRGADLNRNFQFQWNCCGGSSTNQCSSTFNGAGPASEPEASAIQSYLLSIFPDQRDPALSSPAPDGATGVMLDVHSAGGDVLWSWGFTTTDPPNDLQLPACQAVDCSQFNDKTSCNAQTDCRWNNRDKVCVAN
ncbi:MAG: M14 family zinc carboxypeptidase [Thermoanaerobaculia bacterium]